MRGVLLAVGIAVALGATAGLAFLALQPEAPDDREDAAGESGAGERTAASPEPEAQALAIRPYQSFRSLTEDLRDALAQEPDAVPRAFWNVSGRIREAPVEYLEWIVRNESSPRVRALAVLAAGIHAPDHEIVRQRLAEADARVRRAAVLAMGYRPQGDRADELLGVRLPVGRELPAATRAALQSRAGAETDEEVGATIRRVLERTAPEALPATR